MRVSLIDGGHRGDQLWLTHVEDVTERRRAEQLLRFQASHDELTGLANRRQLLDVEVDHEVLKITSGASTSAPITIACRGHYREVAPGGTYEFHLLNPNARDRDENRAGRPPPGAAGSAQP